MLIIVNIISLISMSIILYVMYWFLYGLNKKQEENRMFLEDIYKKMKNK